MSLDYIDRCIQYNDFLAKQDEVICGYREQKSLCNPSINDFIVSDSVDFSTSALNNLKPESKFKKFLSKIVKSFKDFITLKK